MADVEDVGEFALPLGAAWCAGRRTGGSLPDAIRDFLNGQFPTWHELRDECRAAECLGPSVSADWKSYAEKQYGLPITTVEGVRRVIRALDLAGVEMPSIRAVVDEIIAWAAVS